MLWFCPLHLCQWMAQVHLNGFSELDILVLGTGDTIGYQSLPSVAHRDEEQWLNSRDWRKSGSQGVILISESSVRGQEGKAGLHTITSH